MGSPTKPPGHGQLQSTNHVPSKLRVDHRGNNFYELPGKGCDNFKNRCATGEGYECIDGSRIFISQPVTETKAVLIGPGHPHYQTKWDQIKYISRGDIKGVSNIIFKNMSAEQIVQIGHNSGQGTKFIFEKDGSLRANYWWKITAKDTVQKALNKPGEKTYCVQIDKSDLAGYSQYLEPPDSNKKSKTDDDEELENIPEELQTFNEQCFLIEQAKPIFEHFKRAQGEFALSEKDPKFKKNHVRPIHAIPKYWNKRATKAVRSNINYINSITIPGSKIRNFLEIEPNQVAQIIPFMAIYIQYSDSDGKSAGKVPINFGTRGGGGGKDDPINRTDLSLLKSSGERKVTGIKNISITLDGVDSATSNIVTVNASFLFQDIRTLFRQKEVGLKAFGAKGRAKISYADLFSYSGKFALTKNNFLHKKLKFEIGWDSHNHSSEIRKLGLRDKKIVIDATIIKYAFDFKEDGSLELNASYKGILEGLLDGPSSNVLSIVREDFVNLQKQMAEKSEELAEALKDKNSILVEETALQALAIRLYQKIRKENTNVIKGYKGLARTENWNRRGFKGFSGNINAGEVWGKAQMDKWGRFKDPKEAEFLEWEHQGDYFEQSQITNFTLDTKQFITKQLEANGITPTDVKNKVQRVMRLIRKFYEAEFTTEASSSTDKGGARSYRYKQKKFMEWRQMGRNDSRALGKFDLKRILKHQKSKIRSARTQIEKADILARLSVQKEAYLARFIALREIVQLLMAKNKIYNLKLTDKQKANLINRTLTRSAAQNAFRALAVGSLLSAGKQLPSKEFKRSEYQMIPFVFFGDFLNTLLNLPASRSSALKVADLIRKSYGTKFFVDLGYLYYTAPFTGNNIDKFPLYYLPLSLKRLNNFMTRYIVGKELSFFSFKRFTERIIKDFLLLAYNICRKSAGAEDVTLPKIDYALGTSKNAKIWFIYGTDSTSTEIPKKNWGKYTKNTANQIFHLYIGGASAGILKSVKFLDNTDPHLKTALYLKTKGNVNSVRAKNVADQGFVPPMVYKIDVETLGCPLFQLGQLIFIDAQQFIGAAINEVFRITGYYRVYKVSHSISRSTFNTSITAILEESGADKQSRGTSSKTGTAYGKSKGRPPTTSVSKKGATQRRGQTKTPATETTAPESDIRREKLQKMIDRLAE